MIIRELVNAGDLVTVDLDDRAAGGDCGRRWRKRRNPLLRAPYDLRASRIVDSSDRPGIEDIVDLARLPWPLCGTGILVESKERVGTACRIAALNPYMPAVVNNSADVAAATADRVHRSWICIRQRLPRGALRDARAHSRER